MKNKLVNTQFVEEEIIVDVRYVNARAERMMLIDSGAPKSIVSSRWLEGYLRDGKVSNEDVKKGTCARRFRLGKTVYLCVVEGLSRANAEILTKLSAHASAHDLPWGAGGDINMDP